MTYRESLFVQELKSNIVAKMAKNVNILFMDTRFTDANIDKIFFNFVALNDFLHHLKQFL